MNIFKAIALLISKSDVESSPSDDKMDVEQQPLLRPWSDYGSIPIWRFALQKNKGSHPVGIVSNNAGQVQKKWTRLEPSIRFY